MRTAWALALPLVGLHGFTLWAAMHPQVSDAYRAYYIDRLVDLSVAEQARLRPLQAGRRYGLQSPEVVWRGWSTDGDGLGRPAFGVVRIYFDMPSLSLMPIVWLDADVQRGNAGAGVRITLNGQDWAPPWDAGGAHRLTLPRHLLRPGGNVLALDVCAGVTLTPCDHARQMLIRGLQTREPQWP